MTTRQKYIVLTTISMGAAVLTWPFIVSVGIAGLVVYPVAWAVSALVVFAVVREM